MPGPTNLPATKKWGNKTFIADFQRFSQANLWWIYSLSFPKRNGNKERMRMNRKKYRCFWYVFCSKSADVANANMSDSIIESFLFATSTILQQQKTSRHYCINIIEICWDTIVLLHDCPRAWALAPLPHIKYRNWIQTPSGSHKYTHSFPHFRIHISIQLCNTRILNPPYYKIHKQFAFCNDYVESNLIICFPQKTQIVKRVKMVQSTKS